MAAANGLAIPADEIVEVEPSTLGVPGRVGEWASTQA
jgi:hypothetical protein